VRVALVIVALVACAPQIDGPVERQRTIDRHDADRLALQLASLPGAVRADVTLRRPVVDPLTEIAAVLVVIDDRADRTSITRSALALVRGTAPEIQEPSIVIELGAVRPQLANVGPFTVEASDKPKLVALLALALALIALLAGFIAVRTR
jgi:hypothetical protein